MIVYSPGAATSTSVLVASSYLSADDVNRLKGQGVVGDVLSHFVDQDGRLVDPELDSRTLSISLDALRACPSSIAVVTGQEKIPVAKAVLSSGLCKTVITDADIAGAVLRPTA